MKFIHCADLHLGSPFKGLTPAESAKCREGQFAVLTDIIEYAKNNGISLVLMSGDVFDEVSLPESTVKTFYGILRSAKEIRFVISPGNHDYFTEDGFYSKKSPLIPSNVYIFRSTEVDYFDFDDIGVRVYGYAFTSPYMKSCPKISDVTLDFSRFNVLLCHGDFAVPVSDYCPISNVDVCRGGYGYVALGHVHKRAEYRYGNTVIAYSGCPEGRDFGECDDKGVYIVKTQSTDGKQVVCPDYPKFYKISQKRYLILDAVLSSADSDTDACGEIEKAVGSLSDKDKTFLRINLKGSTTVKYIPDLKAIEEQFKSFAHFEAVDLTTPIINAKELEADKSLRGAFYRAMKPRLMSNDDEELANATRALAIGLRAIEGESLVK